MDLTDQQLATLYVAVLAMQRHIERLRMTVPHAVSELMDLAREEMGERGLTEEQLLELAAEALGTAEFLQ